MSSCGAGEDATVTGANFGAPALNFVASIGVLPEFDCLGSLRAFRERFRPNCGACGQFWLVCFRPNFKRTRLIPRFLPK